MGDNDTDIDDLLSDIENSEKKPIKGAPAKKETPKKKSVAKKKAAKRNTPEVKDLPPVIVGTAVLKKLKFNPHNREATEAAVNETVCAIEASKFIMPIVVTKKDEVLDGERRARACMQLGYETIPCIRSDGEFDEITILANYFRTNLTEEELRDVFERMYTGEGMTQQEIGNRIGMSQSRVSQIMKKKRVSKKRGPKKGKKIGRVKLPENVELQVFENRVELTFVLDDEMLKNPVKSITKLYKEIKDLPALVKEGRK